MVMILPGYGDEATWPAAGGPNDPRLEDEEDYAEECHECGELSAPVSEDGLTRYYECPDCGSHWEVDL